jgi:hypothetical protein
MLAGKLRSMFKWDRGERTVEAIIIEAHGITTAPAIPPQLGNKPLREPCWHWVPTTTAKEPPKPR